MNDPTAEERAARLAEIREYVAACVPGWPSPAFAPDLLAEIDRLTAERDAAREIVGRLPKTVDGVLVVPQMMLWHKRVDRVVGIQCNCIDLFAGKWLARNWNDISTCADISECYSTRAAALAATSTGGG